MTLKTKKHPIFTRDGNDLHMTMKISLKEALLGFTSTLTHLDDHEVEVTRTSITKPMSTKKIKGEGMPLHGTPSEFGDLVVKFEVVMPEKLTEEQKTALEAVFPE